MLLDARNLRLAFGGVQGLDDMSFEVAEGAAVGLLGQNGSGKTTLVNVLTGQLRPSSGSVSFKGAPMLGRSPEYFSKAGIGRVFQSVQVFPQLTLLENLKAVQVGQRGHRGVSEEAAHQILVRIGLATYENEWAQDISY